MQDPTLTSLVPGLLAGEDEAIEQLAAAALPRLQRIAARYGAEDPEQIALDVLVRTLSRLPALDFGQGTGRDPLFSYMAKATVLRVKELYRRQEAERKHLERLGNYLLPGAGYLGHLDPARSGRPVWAADSLEPEQPSTDGVVPDLLSTLDDQDRLLLQLRTFSTMTWDEIATEVGLTSPNARQRYGRLVKRVRETLATLATEGSPHV